MQEILEVNDNGSLEIPPQLLGYASPQTRFTVERQSSTLILRPEALNTDTRTPEQRATAFLEWANELSVKFPPLSDIALAREAMYE